MNRIRNSIATILRIVILAAIVVGTFSGLSAQTTVTRLFEEADVLVKDGKYKKAIVKYDSVLNFQATNPKLFYNRALANIYIQKYGPAIVDLNKCISLDSTFYDAYFNRAYVHQILKNTSFALADYNVFIGANPNDHEARFARGKILLQENDIKQAITDISYYTSVVKTNEDAYLALFFAHKQLGISEKALIMLDSAIDLKPTSANLNTIKADYLFDLNRFEEASNSYDKAIASHRCNTSLYVSKAEAKYKLGLYNDAVESMDDALQYESNNASFYYDKAFYLLQGKRYLESKEAIQKAIELNYEDSASAYFIQAVNFNNLGYAEDACLNFKKAFQLGNKEAKDYVAKLCD